MISGMIELLTSQSAQGWAYDARDRRAPLKLRARSGGVTIAQAEFSFRGLEEAGSSPQVERAHTYCLQFPTPLDPGRLFHLSIEAARADGDLWNPLPRYFNIWGSRPDVPEPPKPGWYSGPSHNAETASPAPFWSNAGGSIKSADSRPVFVLGSVRSGTTALCLALEKATRYRGFPEGHVLDIGIRLVNAVAAHFEKKELWISPRESAAYHLGHVPYARLQDAAITLLHSAAQGYNTPFWFDKTPTYQMIASVPVLAQAWPHSRFIFMKRRGLENLRSRIRKFPGMKFAESCKDWAYIMSGWRSIRDTVPDRYIEIDQHDLAEHPEETAAQIGHLLGLEADEVTRIGEVLRKERPEATGSATSFVVDFADLGWTDSQCQIFRESCDKEMEAYGYTYDARYSSWPVE